MRESIYTTPESDLVSQQASGDITKMKRFSAWGVFGLCIITLGIYGFYWLYSRSKSVSEIHQNPISDGLLDGFLFLVFGYFASAFLTLFLPDLSGLFVLSQILSLAYFIVYLVVLFTLRSRLNDIVGRKLNGALTLFFNVIYLQYCINKAIDDES